MKLCKCCGKEFKEYNRAETKCPACRTEKKREKDDGVGVSGMQRRSKLNIKDMPLTDRGEDVVSPAKYEYREPIRGISKNKEKTNVRLAKIKAEKIARLGKRCESCGAYGDVDLSHFIPGAKGLEYKLDPEASCLECRTCHHCYEHLIYGAIMHFRNLNTILAYLETRNNGRYLKIVNGILNLK